MNTEQELKQLQKEVAKQKHIIGTLISWLTFELGTKNVKALTEMLNKPVE